MCTCKNRSEVITNTHKEKLQNTGGKYGRQNEKRKMIMKKKMWLMLWQERTGAERNVPVHCLTQPTLSLRAWIEPVCVCVFVFWTLWLGVTETVTQKEEKSTFDGILVLIKPDPKQKDASGSVPNEQRSFVLKEDRSVQPTLSQYCGGGEFSSVWKALIIYNTTNYFSIVV